MDIGHCRSEVIAMAVAMEERLRANDHKPGWKNDYPMWMVNRCRDELRELDDAVTAMRFQGWSKARAESVRREAADVANFAMMVMDLTAAPGGWITELESEA